MTDPFADPEEFLDYGLKGKDVPLASQNPATKTQNPLALAFSIEDLVGADAYQLTGVQYHGEQHSFRVAKTPLASKTQDGHVEDALKAGNVYRAASAPMVYAIAKTLYENREGPYAALVEQARAALNNIIGPNKPWINTLSRAIYNPQSIDETVHDYGLPTHYSCKKPLVGPRGFIGRPEAQAAEFVQALFDTSDSPQEVSQIFEWITGKPADAWRLTQKPKNQDERVVSLGVYVDTVMFDLYADDGISNGRPALGVLAQKISAGAP